MRHLRRWAFVPCALLAGSVAAGFGCDGVSAPGPLTAPVAGIKAPPGPTPIVGISEPNAWRRDPPPATPEEIATLEASLGVASQRIELDWAAIEPNLPVGTHRYAFASFDSMYEAARRHGIKPLLAALSAPSWAADPLSVPTGAAHNPPAPTRLGDWQDFLVAAARRYPDALGIEVWNEPNLTTFWGSGSRTVRPDPRRYVELLEASYEAVKSVDPQMLVIGGSVAPSPDSPDGDIAPDRFIREILELGAAGYMDALALHPYPGDGGVPQSLAMVDRVRDARDTAGARMPLWLTEIGATTTGVAAVSEEEQARVLVSLCEAVTRQRDVDAIYVHNLIEVPAPIASPEPGFGIVQPHPAGELRPKPAFAALRDALAGHPGCGAT